MALHALRNRAERGMCVIQDSRHAHVWPSSCLTVLSCVCVCTWPLWTSWAGWVVPGSAVSGTISGPAALNSLFVYLNSPPHSAQRTHTHTRTRDKRAYGYVRHRGTAHRKPAPIITMLGNKNERNYQNILVRCPVNAFKMMVQIFHRCLG